jgi:hypothetical protein
MTEPERDDSLRDIVSDYERKELEKSQSLERAEKRQKEVSAAKKLLLPAGICVIVVLVMRLVVIMAEHSEAFSEPRYWVTGRHLGYSKGTEECIGNLWQIRKETDAYYNKEKRFPVSMQELYRAGLFKEKIVCPASGAEYVFMEKDGKKVFSCPNPGRHGVLGLWCKVKGDAPQIEK